MLYTHQEEKFHWSNFKWQQYQKGWFFMMSEKMHSEQQFKKFMIMPLLQNKRFKFKKDFGMQTQNNHATRKP